MRADDPRAAMIDQISEIVRGQTVIQGHQHRANLRHRVKGLKLSVRVRRQISDAIALPNSEALQARGPTIDTIKELRISQAQFAIHHSFALGVELAGAAREFQRGQRRFHLRLVTPTARVSVSNVTLSPRADSFLQALRDQWHDLRR